MNHKKIAKQLRKTNKTAIGNSFNASTTPQDNSERIFFLFVDKNPLFPNNSWQAINEYILASHRRRSDTKSHHRQSCEKVTELFNR